MSTNTALDQIKARVEGHSATPWQVEPYLHSMYDRVRVTSPDDGPDFNTAEDVLPADAELIAAAPKLLAALEAVEALAEAWCSSGSRRDLLYGLRLGQAITEALR